MYLQRKLKKVFSDAVRQFPAVLVTGPRQSGKSTFLLHERPDAAYVTFDDPLNRDFVLRDPNGFLDQFDGKPVVLDEIQYVPEILQHIKIRIDKGRAPGLWVMTGSQQFHLMKNIRETLAGRIVILDLLPFSLAEITDKPMKLEQVLWTGLFPEPACHPKKRDLWLKSYIQTYLERDVRQLEAVRSFRAFEMFVNLCAAHHAQEFHPARLSRDCGTTQPTAKAWARVLEAGFTVIMLRPFFRNYGKRLIKSSKLYFMDPALVAYMTRQPSAGAALMGNMGGALFEGLIVSEAWKAFCNRGLTPAAFFWRSREGMEVDLILQAQGKFWPVEIKLTATPRTDHWLALNRFKEIAGKEAAEQGVIVCRVNTARALPGNNLALPWHRFSEWLGQIIA
jgi:predicted AAA+ superfamily ATPase